MHCGSNVADPTGPRDAAPAPGRGAFSEKLRAPDAGAETAFSVRETRESKNA
jgi:hypothetical protein